MATVNFSVPEELKNSFNKVFSGCNKSAVIAQLVRKAIEEAKKQERRKEVFFLLTQSRKDRPSLTDLEVQKVRVEVRK